MPGRSQEYSTDFGFYLAEIAPGFGFSPHRKGEDAGFGKIMQSFYDFARHDFAAVFIRNRECQLEVPSRNSLMIGVLSS
jgi:hypothetical protein